jgi:hypothetical protein
LRSKAFSLYKENIFNYALTASLRPFPGRNLGCFDAGILITAPVRGLRPSVAARFATVNVPKFTRRTSLPCWSVSVIASKSASIAFC